MKKEQFLINRAKGFFLIEAVFSVAVFSLLVTSFIGVYLYGQESNTLAGDRARAVFLAEEGLEAVRNIREENFANLTAGTYGLSLSGGQWVLSGSSDVTENFTRSITISDIDIDTKNIVSTVFWQQNMLRGGSVSVESRLTNWNKLSLIEADELNVDVSLADINPTNTGQIIGITVNNLSTVSDITVTSMMVSWSGVGGARINGVSVDGTSVWSGNSASGSVLNITDFVLGPAGNYPIDFISFSKNMTGTTITILFTMLDGSTKQVVFSPGAAADVTPPADITNLSSLNVTANSVDLSWTAQGDDGATGIASVYDIRYSISPITALNWSSATQLSGEPSPATAGTAQSMTVSSLSPSTLYYFAMTTSDEASNTSGMSNVISATTLSIPQSNYLVVNTSGMAVNPSNANQIIGITLQNIGPSNIIIASMSHSWTGVATNRRLDQITINGTSVWTGNSNTGATQNITDTIIPAGATVSLNSLTFNRTVTGITLNITFTMSDGSTKVISGLQPL
ncbi:hypothetical protein A3I18_00690 [Candidatus Campbellbacteria bacterium RIFCSPLOWO2_02_FULL_35_11]|uniref:Fibronectin type-III domain-containing protein n=2 Tax=Candidatus Campbelliibacteriota TaxID=1752727 RepID=A0A1F5ENQ9_9BACT|nr:MAG: hypothetical protein A3E89_01240 [Candidatus Campbellbacteria bacterium RIFCSPHIGHO2_12_FULL_35_10]OGD69900.1 MAG: hypothetical protein A3I18_00690 [Candidatus Campbellbacteria bacterium RIFCSPLOWO2_02_FULL_35_11]